CWSTARPSRWIRNIRASTPISGAAAPRATAVPTTARSPSPPAATGSVPVTRSIDRHSGARLTSTPGRFSPRGIVSAEKDEGDELFRRKLLSCLQLWTDRLPHPHTPLRPSFDSLLTKVQTRGALIERTESRRAYPTHRIGDYRSAHRPVTEQPHG